MKPLPAPDVPGDTPSERLSNALKDGAYRAQSGVTERRSQAEAGQREVVA
jgi:hypothetical protein